jgi:hypothetical protein
MDQAVRGPERIAALERLAEADAFGSLGLSRRQALWEVHALAGEPLPLCGRGFRSRGVAARS